MATGSADPWIEEARGDTLAFTFAGRDAARREAATIDARAEATNRSIHAPTWRGTLKWLAWMAMAFLATPALNRWAQEDTTGFRTGVVLPAMLCVAAVGMLAWTMRPRPLPSFADRYRVEIDAANLTVTSLARGEVEARLALADVAGLEGEGRIVVVKMDGERVELPCVLDDREQHPRLAARIADAVVRVRAARGGFRGPRVADVERDEVQGEREEREAHDREQRLA